MGKSRRHHYIAQFYLRNFGHPIFSDNIQVYERASGQWDKRTPRGVGWYPHLYSMFDESGERTDDFEKFLGQHVEDPASAALRKAAESPDSLTREDKEAIALFIGITTARTPAMRGVTEEAYIRGLPLGEVQDLDAVVSLWCSVTERTMPDAEGARREFLKPSVFGAILVWAMTMRDRLLGSEWTFVRTTPDKPFITSDWPVFMYHDKQADIWFVSFPISSEVALVVNSGGTISFGSGSWEDVSALNRRSMGKASEFVVCHQRSFPGDEYLARWRGDVSGGRSVEPRSFLAWRVKASVGLVLLMLFVFAAWWVVRLYMGN